jgi:hypothetical protein
MNVTLSFNQKYRIILRSAALCITWRRSLPTGGPPFLEVQPLTITPLPTGSSAARSLLRVDPARRGTAGRCRCASPRAREPRDAGPSGHVHAFRPDRSSSPRDNWCRETAHRRAFPEAAGDNHKSAPSPRVVAAPTRATSAGRDRDERAVAHRGPIATSLRSHRHASFPPAAAKACAGRID